MMKINDANRKRPVRDDKWQKINAKKEHKHIYKLYLKYLYRANIFE